MKKLTALAMALSFSGVMFAQTATTSTTTTTTTAAKHRMNINQRKENQQDRIAQGVKSGQLTAGETARVEHQEKGLNREERNMRRQDDGKLTARDRRVINRQQNRMSKEIYKDKHNAAKQ